jgi:hypothetical protein
MRMAGEPAKQFLAREAAGAGDPDAHGLLTGGTGRRRGLIGD